MPIEQPRAYVEDLHTKALNAAKAAVKAGSRLNFDPQGHVLIDVEPTEDMKKQFKDATGREPSSKVTVSLDAKKDSDLKREFTNVYGMSEDGFGDTHFDSIAWGSIIPLQQEFHFHLGLTARTYTKINPSAFPEKDMEDAHAEAMTEINKLVIKAFQEAREKASRYNKKGELEIDDVKLIKSLDKARKEISDQAHKIFLQKVMDKTGNYLSKQAMEDANVKHVAETTTATPNDFLHIDSQLGLFTLIEGTEITAHDRGLGTDHLSNRQIITISMDKEKQTNPRIQVRTSSLDVKKLDKNEKVTEQDLIGDVSDKLAFFADRYQLSEKVDAHPSGIKAFTYNLLTAINDPLEGGGNKQSQGAGFILAGAHKYNELQKDKNPKVYAFVQNISVNGFGDTLGYDSTVRGSAGWAYHAIKGVLTGKSKEVPVGNQLRREATLMTELAMLYNLAGLQDKKAVGDILNKYEAYLKIPNHPLFFSESSQGKAVIAEIQNIKKNWKTSAGTNDIANKDDPHTAAAKAALKTILANDLHYSHEFAKTIQALSVFVEQASIAGCKSGNERAQAISGRVAVLDSADNDILKSLNSLATAKPNDVKSMARALKESIDQKYDKHLQTAAAAISQTDQGAAAKLNAAARLAALFTTNILKGIKIGVSFFNRNYAEEATLERLHQDKAGKMQAHKGLTEQMMAAVEILEKEGGTKGKTPVEEKEHNSLSKALRILSIPGENRGTGPNNDAADTSSKKNNWMNPDTVSPLHVEQLNKDTLNAVVKGHGAGSSTEPARPNENRMSL